MLGPSSSLTAPGVKVSNPLPSLSLLMMLHGTKLLIREPLEDKPQPEHSRKCQLADLKVFQGAFTSKTRRLPLGDVSSPDTDHLLGKQWFQAWCLPGINFFGKRVMNRADKGIKGSNHELYRFLWADRLEVEEVH